MADSMRLLLYHRSQEHFVVVVDRGLLGRILAIGGRHTACRRSSEMKPRLE